MTISATSKERQEHSQEIRNPRKNSIRYRKRKLEEKLADKAAKDDLESLKDSNASTKQVY